MTDFAGTFDRHEIRDRVIAPHFGSWRLMRRTESRWTGVFWCRITAADGLLRVSGDFDPIVFQGHLSHEDDPVSRVAWMGQREGRDSYVCEKARSGSGRDACTRWDVDSAHEDLRALISEASEEIDAELEAEFEDYGTTGGRVSSDDPLCAGRVPDEDSPTVSGLREYIAACQSGIDATLQYDGREGVHEMLEAIRDCPHAIEMEDVYSIGVRPSSGLELAHLAVRRLHELLTAEATAKAEHDFECHAVDLNVAEARRRGDIEVQMTALVSDSPPKHSIPGDVISRAVEACYHRSTLEYGHLHVDARAALRVMLFGEYLGHDDPFQRWPDSAFERIDNAGAAAFHKWIAARADRKCKVLADDEGKHEAVAIIVDAIACLVDAAYHSQAYRELLPVAVLLGARLSTVRSGRAAVDGMWDVLATWPDDSKARIAWNENASADDVAAVLSEARHA